MEKNLLSSDKIASLAVLIEESIRSTERGVRRFVEPAAGTFIKATSKTHSIVFGRRGSGKSSLLRKAAADLVHNSPIAYIDLETFKDHSYPDVLLSILIETFGKFEEWLEKPTDSSRSPAFLRRFLDLFVRKHPINHRAFETLAKKFAEKKKELTNLLHESDNISIQKTHQNGAQNYREGEINAGINSSMGAIRSGLKEKEGSSSMEEIVESFQHSKIEFLLRHILEYQELFRSMSLLTNGDSFLFLDDLYYIKRSDQAKVIDFFHRIAKGNNLWLKIGTVRYRSTWYVHGDPPYGLKLGDDAHEINLDLTLEKYSTTKAFLVKILEAFVKESGIGTIKDIVVDDAIDRLVLASGGVARDFLGIFNKSITVAQERVDKGEVFRGQKIGKEAVNVAAGKYSTTKMDEFRTDILSSEEHISLEDAFKRIRSFCLNQANSNIFLYDKANENGLGILQELMDLRLIHKVDSHVTVSKRQGRLFEAYMLDVSAYSEMRKKREFNELMFWRKETNIRRLGLILEDDYLFSQGPLPDQTDRLETARSEDLHEAADNEDRQLPLGF